MKESQIQKMKAWEQTRKMGLWKYVLFQGFFWGVIVCFISRLFDLNKRSFSDIYFSRSGLLAALFYIAAGVLMYLSFWWFGERNYKKLKEKSGAGVEPSDH